MNYFTLLTSVNVIAITCDCQTWVQQHLSRCSPQWVPDQEGVHPELQVEPKSKGIPLMGRLADRAPQAWFHVSSWTLMDSIFKHEGAVVLKERSYTFCDSDCIIAVPYTTMTFTPKVLVASSLPWPRWSLTVAASGWVGLDFRTLMETKKQSQSPSLRIRYLSRWQKKKEDLKQGAHIPDPDVRPQVLPGHASAGWWETLRRVLQWVLQRDVLAPLPLHAGQGGLQQGTLEGESWALTLHNC